MSVFAPSSGAAPSSGVAAGSGSSSSALPTGIVPPSAVADGSSLAAFLHAGLTLLYKHASKKHDHLRQQCVEVISRLKSEETARREKEQAGVISPPDSDANRFFLPLKLACDTGQAKLVAIALDTMEKLIAYGYLDGNCAAPEDRYPITNKTDSKKSTPAQTPVPQQKSDTNDTGSAPSTPAGTAVGASSLAAPESRRKLIHVMLETLYECSMYKDAVVQRQVLKCLLTTVSSISCPVHDHALLQAVTSCFQIFLQAADETNRTTSKAALTQIFNIVFQRMEHFAQQLHQLEEAAKGQRDQRQARADSAAATDASVDLTVDIGGRSPTDESDATQVDANESTSLQLDIDTDSEAQPVEPSIGADESDGGEFSTSISTPPSSSILSASRSSPTLVPRPPPGKRGYCVVCQKPANHTCLQTRDSVCGMECKLQNLSRKDPNRISAISVRTKIQSKLQILQNDAYYLLRALIKLSHKSFLTVPPEPAAVDSKLLSLTLLLSVMQNAGPTFTTHRTFLHLIKGDLVSCLLRNSAASTIDAIFTLTSNIFVALMRHFKPHLHKVIGPMLDSIYIPYIQSPNSSFAHKATSLRVIQSICEDPQLVVDLFLNYDCDLASFSTFQKITEVLEKNTHRRAARVEEAYFHDDDDGRITDAEEAQLSRIALEALVGCLNSLAVWTDRIVKPNAQSMQELEAAMEHASNSTGGRTTALAAIGAAMAAAAMSAQADDGTTRSTVSVDSDSQPSASPSPPPAPLSTGLTLASSFSAQFQHLRQQKQKLDSGVSKFNQKPKVGLAYLHQHALVGTEPHDIATFFHTNTGLDKVQLGEYMGEDGDFNKKVLYAYVEQCLVKGETVALADGGRKTVEEVREGDRLVGHCGQSVRVAKETITHPQVPVYTVVSDRGEFTVSAAHKLTLRWCRSPRLAFGRARVTRPSGDIVDSDDPTLWHVRITYWPEEQLGEPRTKVLLCKLTDSHVQPRATSPSVLLAAADSDQEDEELAVLPWSDEHDDELPIDDSVSACAYIGDMAGARLMAQRCLERLIERGETMVAGSLFEMTPAQLRERWHALQMVDATTGWVTAYAVPLPGAIKESAPWMPREDTPVPAVDTARTVTVAEVAECDHIRTQYTLLDVGQHAPMPLQSGDASDIIYMMHRPLVDDVASGETARGQLTVPFQQLHEIHQVMGIEVTAQRGIVLTEVGPAAANTSDVDYDEACRTHMLACLRMGRRIVSFGAATRGRWRSDAATLAGVRSVVRIRRHHVDGLEVVFQGLESDAPRSVEIWFAPHPAQRQHIARHAVAVSLAHGAGDEFPLTHQARRALFALDRVSLTDVRHDPSRREDVIAISIDASDAKDRRFALGSGVVTHNCDFRECTFDDAIRMFVQGFRLPGEAQKIDRMMEKFAEQYHRHNPGRFHSADTAYVLAYSIILLNTDAHNPGVKRRMTKEDFFKNCRGIDDGKDIDPAFLGEIYDRITTNEIRMKDDPLVSDASRSKSTGGGDTKTRFSAFVKESQTLVKRTQELIKTKVVPPKNGNRLSHTEKKYLEEIGTDELDQPEGDEQEVRQESDATRTNNAQEGDAAIDDGESKGRRPSVGRIGAGAGVAPREKVFYEATDADAEAIRPMFEILCFPSLAILSLLLEESEEDAIIRLCLAGYRSSIRTANALEMRTARLAFVSSLKQFTYLGSGKEMRRKHIDAIAALLGLAANSADGNHLKDNWVEILQCISEVERLHLIANNSLRGRETNFTQELVSGSGAVAAATNAVVIAPLGGAGGQLAVPSVGVGMRPAGKETEAINSLQVYLIDASAIDRVFAASAHLDGEAIVDFVSALREVSEQELSSPVAPRVFSLQKMVEITYFNMGRIRVVWTRIWSLLSAFFQQAGCHPHLHVSMYAIDSLRQLAMKFLEKDELTSYQFQKQFLAPFEFIMSNNHNSDVRDLVLQCIARMINAKVANIKSGWKGVFMVITVAATTGPDADAKSTTATGGGGSTLVEVAFGILASIMDSYFQLVSENGLETMDALVNCLVTFGGQQRYEDIAVRAIQYISKCAEALNPEGDIIAAGTDGEQNATPVQRSRRASTSSGASTPRLVGLATPSSAAPAAIGFGGAAMTKVWFLVLTGLSRLISDRRASVRSLALTTLFQILGTHGHIFTAATWRAVFHGVLLPIFDDVRDANEKQADAASRRAASQSAVHARRQSTEVGPAATGANGGSSASSSPVARKSSLPPRSSSGDLTRSIASSSATPPFAAVAHIDPSWLQTTCFTALSALVDLFARFHSTLHFMLDDIMRLLHACIGQDHSADLAKIGVRCFGVMMSQVGSDLTVGEWWTVLRHVQGMMAHTTPTVIVTQATKDAMGVASTQTSDAYTSIIDPSARPAAAESTDESSVPPSNGDTVATAASPAAPARALPPTLPFSLPCVHTRLRAQLWLVEALCQIVVPFFPDSDMESRGVRHDDIEEELAATKPVDFSEVDTTRGESAPDTAAPTAAVSSESAPPRLFDSSDRRLLGCLTPSQILVVVDLLGAYINFTHAFNSDIALRRKLHSAGFFVPTPTTPQANGHTTQGGANTNSTVPPSPVTHTHTLFSSSTPISAGPPPPPPQPAQSKPARLPQLFYHEAHATRLVMDILFKMVTEGRRSHSTPPSTMWQQEIVLPKRSDDADDTDAVSRSEQRLISMCDRCIGGYISKTHSGQLVSLEHMDEVLVGLITNFSSLPPVLFERFLRRFYDQLTMLIEFAHAATIRHAIRQLFANNIREIIFKATDDVDDATTSTQSA